MFCKIEIFLGRKDFKVNWKSIKCDNSPCDTDLLKTVMAKWITPVFSVALGRKKVSDP